MKIIESILTNNPCYKEGKKITVKGLMLHSVGCPQPSAEVFVRKWNVSTYDRACVHAFIDANTGYIYQTLPWNHRGWHGGGSSNNTHIGVEMCEPACIKYTGGSNFTCSDHEQAIKNVKTTYNAAVELFAFLCKQYNLDPMKDGVIVSHYEGYKRGIASGHQDPHHLWDQLNAGYTMDQFRKDVKKKMTESSISYKVQMGPYKNKKDAVDNVNILKSKGFEARVINVNGEIRIQCGAFSSIANANSLVNRLISNGFDAYVITSGGDTPSPTPAPTPKPVETLKVGDKVKVLKNETYTGKQFKVYHEVYDVIRIDDNDRIVIGIGKAVTCAINKKNIQKV